MRARPAGSGGGVVLDAHGGLHAFGGFALDTAGAEYWPGQDLARSAAVRADGSGGWVLDAWGGIHAFGRAPKVTSPRYTPGSATARAIALTSKGPDGLPDGRQGYLLDGTGGLHPWGGAPFLSGAPSWGADRARGLEIHYDAAGRPDGGWVLDAAGTTSAFGAAPPLDDAIVAEGKDAWQSVHAVGAEFYFAGRFGVVHRLGAGSPDWSGFRDFGAADLVRDVVLVGPLGAGGHQPLSPEAVRGFLFAAFDPPARAAAVPLSSGGSGSTGVDPRLERVAQCESGGNYRAKNPRSTASGKYQILDSTWNGYGGYRRAMDAPPAVQDAKAKELWAGGRGANHWRACL